jgi:hypothetical protein
MLTYVLQCFQKKGMNSSGMMAEGQDRSAGHFDRRLPHQKMQAGAI